MAGDTCFEPLIRAIRVIRGLDPGVYGARIERQTKQLILRKETYETLEVATLQAGSHQSACGYHGVFAVRVYELRGGIRLALEAGEPQLAVSISSGWTPAVGAICGAIIPRNP